MKRLSGTDSLFLSMETPSWHQHVGGLSVLEPGPRGLGFEDVLASVAERIGYAPKFTWKLATTPLGLDRPGWVDDPDFDVRRHVNRIGVPSPGGAKEVGEVCGTLLSSQLDRGRPLWEIWVLDGLAGGRDRMDFGLHVDADLVPDPWLIADAIPLALAELFAASGLGEPSPVVDPFAVAAPRDVPIEMEA